ncbi:MAG: hypothetical protein G01um101425_36 [Candidatus Peregrinibacteria bacterium Gr01-1014_25]|nr:MAG: hypothetical protein G01um101425_36 [Candidatus Peregrinibacteria bacterium Gr01-1014_25]
MRRVLYAVILQAYAVALAVFQLGIGVRTDEAKYLLNIPYPHPPLARALFSLTEAFPWQEALWRLVLATALVQAAWIVADCARDRPVRDRIALCVAWLLAPAMLLQAGTIMLAPLTALGTLLLVWCIARQDRLRAYQGIVGLLWLGNLFVAYQGILALPLAWRACSGVAPSRLCAGGLVALPVALLALYSLTNPLALATMLIHGAGGAMPSSQRFLDAGNVLLLTGIPAVVLGTWGILRYGSWSLRAAALLTAAFILLSAPHAYYAILLLPLGIEGIRQLLSRTSGALLPVGVMALAIVGSVVALPSLLRRPPPSVAVSTLTMLQERRVQGVVLLVGPFGHEWQYSPLEVRRFVPELLPRGSAVVCLRPCPVMRSWSEQWKETATNGAEVWLRR